MRSRQKQSIVIAMVTLLVGLLVAHATAQAQTERPASSDQDTVRFYPLQHADPRLLIESIQLAMGSKLSNAAVDQWSGRIMVIARPEGQAAAEQLIRELDVAKPDNGRPAQDGFQSSRTLRLAWFVKSTKRELSSRHADMQGTIELLKRHQAAQVEAHGARPSVGHEQLLAIIDDLERLQPSKDQTDSQPAVSDPRLHEVLEELKRQGVTGLQLAAQPQVEVPVGEGFVFQTTPEVVSEGNWNFECSGHFKAPDRVQLQLTVRPEQQVTPEMPGRPVSLNTSLQLTPRKPTVLAVSPSGSMTHVFVLTVE